MMKLKRFFTVCFKTVKTYVCKRKGIIEKTKIINYY